MNLKSLRKSYSNLLGSFREAGVVLNESQQENLDTFMLSLEKKLNETRDNAIKATKKIVTEHLESEYRKAFESLMEHMEEHNTLAAKIQNKITQINERKEISNAVDNYLDLYMEEVLPKKSIVDYGRMQKLESIQESLRNLLFVNDNTIEEKKVELEESFKHEKDEYEKKISDLNKKLNESMQKELDLNRKLGDEKAKSLLESKVKDLPEREAKLVKENLKNASSSEIKMKFKTVLESVREEIDEEIVDQEEEKSLEEAINSILEDAASSKKKTNDGEGDEESPAKEEPKSGDSETEDAPRPEDQETIDEDYDTVNDAIDESTMVEWIRMAQGKLF